MGELNVKLPTSQKEVQDFMKFLLQDVRALEKMLESDDLWDTETIRIGAEQEMCLVDDSMKPAMLNMEVLKEANNEMFTSELAKFNLESNVNPMEFTGDCLSALEKDIIHSVDELKKAASKFDTKIIMVGILPTIRQFDLDINNLTPLDRYFALIESIKNLRGEEVDLNIKGIDELLIKHDSPLFEACNTGYQVHLQVKPSEFAARYNIAQIIAGPVLASATFSPILLGKRLWKETRVALFQQAIDTRTSGDHLRDRSPRVTFGDSWLDKSILDIYKEDISRFRVLLSVDEHTDSVEQLKQGIVPQLRALNVHNGTVYRWNRPCYGVKDGVPHLRIEFRPLPAGPTVVDEIANTALWLGLMNGLGDVHPNMTKQMDFSDAKANFFAACRNGLDTQMVWLNDNKYSASDLISKELLPIAQEGLDKAGVSKEDSEKYLGIIKERCETGQTGSYWLLKSFSSLTKETTKDEALIEIAAATIRNQEENIPAHLWPMAELTTIDNWNPRSLIVEEFMTTDIFTVQKDDIIELAAEMMDFRKIRFIPVEDKEGKIVGLITSRMLLRYYSQNPKESKENVLVKDVMIENPLTVSPSMNIVDALEILREKGIGSLPVTKNDKLIGIITEQNFLRITNSLITRMKSKRSE